MGILVKELGLAKFYQTTGSQFLDLIKPSIPELMQTAVVFDAEDPRRQQLIALLYLDQDWLNEVANYLTVRE